jgi:enoyl-CoA hydratase/carnithine racemase
MKMAEPTTAGSTAEPTAAQSTLVHLEVKDGVAYLTLDDPPANTYTHVMMRQLDECILKARFDKDVYVIVLRGQGDKFFCAGANINMLKSSDPYFKYYFCLHANETLNRLEQTPKLVIAALNGHCVGGGLEVAMAADIRIARKGAGKIGLPEVGLGVLPGTGGTQRLVRLVGKARALELMATGRLFEFEEAQALGLVNEVVEAADGEAFLARVRARAQEFTPPHRASKAVGLIKRAVQTGAEVAFHDALALERELQQQLFESEDAREGLAAHVEKRKAAFPGR